MCLLFYMKRRTYCTTKLTQGALVKLLSSAAQSITTRQTSSSIWLTDLLPLFLVNFEIGLFWNTIKSPESQKKVVFEILWTFSIIFEEKGVKTLVGCIEKLRVGEKKSINKKRKGEKNTSWKGYSSYTYHTITTYILDILMNIEKAMLS